MKEKDGKEDYDVVGGILSPTLTVEEKTEEEVYKEAFDHFDGNHSKTIPTSVSWKKLFKINIHQYSEPDLRATKSWVKSNRGGDSGHDQPGFIVDVVIGVIVDVVIFSCLRFFIP